MSILIKLLMIKMPVLFNSQFLCQVFGVIFAIYMFDFVIKEENVYVKLPAGFIKVIDFISKYSLEIYLAQRTAQKISENTSFPCNLLIALILTMIYAMVLKEISKKAGKLLLDDK